MLVINILKKSHIWADFDNSSVNCLFSGRNNVHVHNNVRFTTMEASPIDVPTSALV